MRRPVAHNPVVYRKVAAPAGKPCGVCGQFIRAEVADKPCEGCQINAHFAAESARHESAAGALCTEGREGCCVTCGVEMTVCGVCHGIGYHREGCRMIGGDAL